MQCPNCHSRSIGRVGAEQYYCWDCCVEFNLARGSVRVYHLDADGELIAATSFDNPDWLAGNSPGLRRR